MWLICFLWGPVDNTKYRKTLIVSRTLVYNKNADQSDAAGASPVGAAPNTSSYLT